MKSIAWAIIIASLHMMPNSDVKDTRPAILAVFSLWIFAVYVGSWIGFFGALREKK